MTAPADNLLLAAGHGGGAGGQGGGGGGGSSGGGGGGGGLAWTTWYSGQCNTPVDGTGGAGGAGGVGGSGGSGGQGGAALTGAPGGAGGHGGGVAVLSARGLLSFGGVADISSSAPASGGAQPGAQPGNPGSDPGNNGNSGGTGNNGGQGVWWTTFFGCWPTYVNGGQGGNGGTGGAGGVGGTGGSSGVSGAGGAGGLGTPGMIKLHGSVVLAAAGNVTCNNHTADSAETLRGRYTTITNLSGAYITLPTFSDDIVTGVTTNHDVLRAPAPYNSALSIPLIPQLQGGVATGGFCESSFWNQSSVITPGVDMLEVVDLGSSTPFSGFRQIFLVNTGQGDAHDVVLRVQATPDYLIGTVPNGEIWTTCIPDGVNYFVDVGMDITLGPATADLYVGESLSLMATVVGGRGNKVFLWLRDDLVVSLGNNTYDVNPVTLADAGTYEVWVTDITHSEPGDNVAVVTVDPPVTITTQPLGASLVEGENHVLTVVAEGGKGALDYNWRKDGLSMGAPNNPFLALGPVTLLDAGVYDVVVTDSKGVPPYGYVVSMPANVTVSSNPLHVTDPEDAVAYDDAPFVPFTVIVTGGIPPYTYTWYKDGTAVDLLDPPIPQPNIGTLGLSPPLREGLYRCVVVDSNTPPTQLESGEGRLTVHPHLAIAEHPNDAVAHPGDMAVFTAVVEGGIPPLTYIWRKNGSPLPPAEQPGGPELVLASVSGADAGEYDLVVSDSGTDEETTVPASLTVNTEPLVFTLHPVGAERFIDEGPYTLTALAEGGNGPIHYRWRFDDGGGPVTVGTDSPAYEITNPAAELSGWYWCEASEAEDFSVGVIMSNPAEVIFRVRLVIVEQPLGADRYVDEGDYSLSTLAQGGTAPILYEWYFDPGVGGEPLHVGSGPILLLGNPTEADSGMYFCVATDAENQQVISDAARMLFASRMAFARQPESGAVAPGDSWKFEVELSGGLRTLSYEWIFEPFYNGKYLKSVGENSPVLLLTDVTEADAGIYYVNVADSRSLVTSEAAYLMVGLGVPAAGSGGIALLALGCAAGGAHLLRRLRRRQ